MNRIQYHVVMVAALFAMLVGLDLRGEDEAISAAEYLTEDALPWLVLAMAVAAASYSALRFRDAMAERHRMSAELAATRQDGDRWRSAARAYSDGLGKAIRGQFSTWRLTASESDVAMLMLKGLSHKEIAALRASSSATVRQQAAAIYAKSGLTSRAELAAFFLEDLFPSQPGAIAGQRLPDALAALDGGSIRQMS